METVTTSNVAEIGRQLSLREAADTLRISTRQLRRLIKSGEIRVWRAGNRFRIEAATLRAFIDSGGSPAPSERKEAPV